MKSMSGLIMFTAVALFAGSLYGLNIYDGINNISDLQSLITSNEYTRVTFGLNVFDADLPDADVAVDEFSPDVHIFNITKTSIIDKAGDISIFDRSEDNISAGMSELIKSFFNESVLELFLYDQAGTDFINLESLNSELLKESPEAYFRPVKGVTASEAREIIISSNQTGAVSGFFRN